MQHKFLHCIVLLLMVWISGRCQQLSEKRFDISFHNEPFKSALSRLSRTQPQLSMSYDNSKKSLPVTMDCHNVSFDEAMTRMLAAQPSFKAYIVINYGSFSVCRLKEEDDGAPRYFERDKNKGKFYHVGDILPDSFYTVSNYIDKSIRLSDLHKKLVIIDLWGINCSSCIDAMPEMEKLQQEFGDRIQIILATKDSPDLVNMLKKRVKIVRECKLPSITGENMLPSLFDYVGVPRQIWIDETGVIRYATSKTIATSANIQDFILGKRMALYETKDTTVGADSFNNPMASALHFIHKSDFSIASCLAPHKETQYSYFMYSYGFHDSATVKSLTQQRIDLYSLYKIAYGFSDSDRFSDSRIIRHFKDQDKYDPDDVTNANMFDYELITKKRTITIKQFLHLMQQELDAYFGLQSSLRKISLPCYVLTRVGPSDRLRPAGDVTMTEINGKTITAAHVPYGYLLQVIDSHRRKLWPLLDETGLSLTEPVDCTIDLDFEHGLPAVNKGLAPYGLRIDRTERESTCIVLEDMVE